MKAAAAQEVVVEEKVQSVETSFGAISVLVRSVAPASGGHATVRVFMVQMPPLNQPSHAAACRLTFMAGHH
jgi:hypothetical protein